MPSADFASVFPKGSLRDFLPLSLSPKKAAISKYLISRYLNEKGSLGSAMTVALLFASFFVYLSI
jgi:hypothetical protein